MRRKGLHRIAISMGILWKDRRCWETGRRDLLWSRKMGFIRIRILCRKRAIASISVAKVSSIFGRDSNRSRTNLLLRSNMGYLRHSLEYLWLSFRSDRQIIGCMLFLGRCRWWRVLICHHLSETYKKKKKKINIYNLFFIFGNISFSLYSIEIKSKL